MTLAPIAAPARAGWLALAGAALLCLCATAQAGIVVLKNGKVVVGTIPAETDGPEKLILKRPVPLQPDERGELEFLKADIRWYSREHDAPTPEYWEKFENEKIADEFLPGREKWRLAREQEAQLKELSSSGDPSKESAEMATTPDEKKAAAPAAPAPEPAPAAPAPAPEPAPSSGGGFCALQRHAAQGTPLGLLLLAGALLWARRRAS